MNTPNRNSSFPKNSASSKPTGQRKNTPSVKRTGKKSDRNFTREPDKESGRGFAKGSGRPFNREFDRDSHSKAPRRGADKDSHDFRDGWSHSPRHHDASSYGARHQEGDGFSQDMAQNTSQAPLLLGVKPVLEMLASAPERIDAVFIRKGRHGKDMDEILDLCRKAKVRFSLLDPANFSRQLGQTQTQGVVARLFEAGFTPLEELLANIMEAPLPLLVALDQVQDPGNAGTLARTLYSLGGAGLIIPRHNSVYLGAGATRAAAGALQKLPVARVGSLTQAIDSAKKLGITIYGAAAADDTIPVADIFTLTPRLPALLILGSEESGIRQTLMKRCDSLVSIPMQRDFDSLNVAQAGAICIASFLRHQLGK